MSLISYTVNINTKKMQSRVVKIYRNQDGKEPLVDWLESVQDITTRARIKNRLRRLELGNLGDTKSVGQGVYELRLDFGPGFRVYFGNVDNMIVLLLCGGDKGSQTKDIKKAIEYWFDYKHSHL